MCCTFLLQCKKEDHLQNITVIQFNSVIKDIDEMQTNYLSCSMEQLEGFRVVMATAFSPFKVLVNALIKRDRNILDVEFYSCNCSTALSRLQ